jgi:hypothetical protein
MPAVMLTVEEACHLPAAAVAEEGTALETALATTVSASTFGLH